MSKAFLTKSSGFSDVNFYPINKSPNKETEFYEKKLWRVNDVAKFLGCSVGHVYNLCSDEKIPKRKKGKFLFFIPNEILEWVIQGDCL